MSEEIKQGLIHRIDTIEQDVARLLERLEKAERELAELKAKAAFPIYVVPPREVT